MRSSGRGVLRKKMLIGRAFRMDVQMLKRQGLFNFDSSVSWSFYWQKDKRTGPSLECRFVHDAQGQPGLRLEYTVVNNTSGERKDFDYVVSLVTTPCHFGGVRWWFICPLTKNNVPCQRRCRYLYLPPGSMLLGCRECFELTYETRQRHRDRFYEWYHKPMHDMEQAKKVLDTTRSFKKMAKAMRKIKKAEAKMERFDDFLLARLFKIRKR